MTPIFLDTVGLLAQWDERDQWHLLAEKALDDLERAGDAVFWSTSYVLLECGNASARKPYRDNVGIVRLELEGMNRPIHPTHQDWIAAWSDYDRGLAGGAGIVDQVSFTVMRRLGIKKAFTNDNHFRAAGFECLF